ncbi:MAG: hypothetical protein LLF76_05020 [Planctomycetaceae bacterium]|nr:hypothetical protein [Planctomycetaceae bacterium]
MLKTLRITSLAAVIVTACGVVFILVLGFRGDPEARALLQQPGVTEKYKDAAGKGQKKLDEVHPLVAEAKKIALRFNPPPPTLPKIGPKAAAQVLERKPELPKPPAVQQAKFELLATVHCEADPKRSLALLRSGTTADWFHQGEKAGHLTVDEIRNGSAVFSQDGRNPQTLVVPAKTQGRSLLKNDQSAIAAARPGPSTPVGVIASPADFRARAAQAHTLVNTDGDVQSASRIQRIRAEVPEQTVEEHAAQLDSTIAGIQEVMKSSGPDEGLSEAEKKAEQETWQELLRVLQSEKENLKTAAAQPAAESEKPAPSRQPVPPPAQRQAPDEAAAQAVSPVEDEGEGQPAPQPPAEAQADPPAQPPAEAQADSPAQPPAEAEADPPAQPQEASADPPNEY